MRVSGAPTEVSLSALPRRRVLLWVFLDTHFREMIRVARLLRPETGYEPCILFTHVYPQIPRDEGVCWDEGIRFEWMSDDRPPDPPSPPGFAGGEGTGVRGDSEPTENSSFRKGMIAWANRICDRIPLLGSIRQLLWVCREVRRVSAKVEACLDRIRPALIVLPEDNVEYTTGTFVKAGRERGIPTLIIPYTMANAIEPAESYLNVGPYDGARRMNRLISFFYPHWRYVHKGKMLVRLPNYWILAKEWLGVAPPRPWAINSSHADRVVVESEESFDYHRASGLDPRSLAVLGSPRMDELARFANRAAAEREALLAELGLPPRRLLVVCALPPNQNPDSRPGCEFDAYPALLRCWIDALARLPDVNLVLVPHPRNGAEEMAPFRRPEIRFVAGDIARYIAVCDLYVASVSATIGLAIACGKPVVNYDVYRYDYSDFRDVPGVLTMVDRASFERTLDRLVREPEFLAQIRELQRQAAPRWGLLDGRCGERLLREMNRHCGVPEKSLPLARSA